MELATEVRTCLFLAHVRAGTGTPMQQTNCHPFRYRNWLAGSTDSELLFHLALTFGLTDDPTVGIARMAGFVEANAAAAGVDEPALQMTVGVSDGVRLYAARDASGTEANTLFVAEDLQSVRMLYPDNERLVHFGDFARGVAGSACRDRTDHRRAHRRASLPAHQRGSRLTAEQL